jgi:hypothetical protein
MHGNGFINALLPAFAKVMIEKGNAELRRCSLAFALQKTVILIFGIQQRAGEGGKALGSGSFSGRQQAHVIAETATAGALLMKNCLAEKLPQTISAVNLKVQVCLLGKIFQRGNPPPEFAVRMNIGIVKPTSHLMTVLAEEPQRINSARAAADMEKYFHQTACFKH